MALMSVNEQPHFVVQAAGAIRYLLGVTALMLIAPEVGNGAQRYQQRGRAHQHNIVF